MLGSGTCPKTPGLAAARRPPPPSCANGTDGRALEGSPGTRTAPARRDAARRDRRPSRARDGRRRGRRHRMDRAPGIARGSRPAPASAPACTTGGRRHCPAAASPAACGPGSNRGGRARDSPAPGSTAELPRFQASDRTAHAHTGASRRYPPAPHPLTPPIARRRPAPGPVRLGLWSNRKRAQDMV